MLIYKAESDIADAIQNSLSTACIGSVEIVDEIPEYDLKIAQANISTETPKNAIDLFYLRSVLVSSGTNLNDDTFLPHELYAARFTSVDKPLNIEHNPDDIIGHITSNWVIGADGKMIDEAAIAEEIPNNIHIGNGAVIYRIKKDSEAKQQANITIESIKRNEKSVSMEVLFSNFDYGLHHDEGEFQIIERNSETAFLTKRLRTYGGEGEFEGRKLSRVLRNMIFSGIAVVDKPANPNSVIFHFSDDISTVSFAKNSTIGDLSKNNGVIDIRKNINDSNILPKTNQTTNNIGNTKIMSDQAIAKLEAKIDELSKANKSLEDRLAEANVKSLEDQITELKAGLAATQDITTKLTEAEAKIEELKASEACMCGKFEEVSLELEKAKKEVDEKDNALNELRTKITQEARINQLIEKGLKKDEAVAEEKELRPLSDEMFEKVVARIHAKSEKPTEQKVDEETEATIEPKEGEQKLSVGSVEGDKPKPKELEQAEACSNKFSEHLSALFA